MYIFGQFCHIYAILACFLLLLIIYLLLHRRCLPCHKEFHCSVHWVILCTGQTKPFDFDMHTYRIPFYLYVVLTLDIISVYFRSSWSSVEDLADYFH